MNIGIIAEYNPLHNGHVYQFKQIKKMYPDSIISVIIDSEFSQRGELTVFNKFDRTKLALDMGADLVLSNPLLTSMQCASDFAFFNIHYLNLINIDAIAFGSEEADQNMYRKYYDASHTELFEQALKEDLNKGKSYKSAYLNAFQKIGLNPLKSNDLLGFFYYQAIQEINPNIKIIVIKRKDSSYLDDYIPNSTIQSASYIRTKTKISYFVPKYTDDLFLEKGYRNQETLFNYLVLSILNNDTLSKLAEASEGLEGKLNEIYKYHSLIDFKNFLKSKRYSISKINRLLVDALFKIEDKPIVPNFVRILGFNEIGKNYLNSIKKTTTIYTNIKEGISPILDLELKVSKILDVIFNSNLLKNEQKGPLFLE